MGAPPPPIRLQRRGHVRFDACASCKSGCGGIHPVEEERTGYDGMTKEYRGEAQPARGIKVYERPIDREVEEHALTHVPLRSWCPHCVTGRSGSSGHSVLGKEESSHLGCFCIHEEKIWAPGRGGAGTPNTGDEGQAEQDELREHDREGRWQGRVRRDENGQRQTGLDTGDLFTSDQERR